MNFRKGITFRRWLRLLSTALWATSKAFDWLEKSYADRYIGLGGVDLKLNPNWDPLRSDPRFADLVRRVNL